MSDVSDKADRAEKEARTSISVSKTMLRRLALLSDALDLSHEQLLATMMEEFVKNHRQAIEDEIQRRAAELKTLVLGA